MADLPPSTVDPERARQAVADVLSRPEYADAAPSLWERIQGEIARLLGELWMRLAGTGGGTLLGNLVLLGIVVLVGFAVWRLARSVRRDRAQDQPLAADVGRSAASWRDEADAHEEAGRWRQAVRCRYRALIADLAAQGQIQEVPGRTTGEYLAAVRRDLPDLAEPFARATGVFEAAWYGPDEVTEADVTAMRDAAEHMTPVGGRR